MNIKDVAKMAGVSISTVSRVINNTAKVNEDTRARVEKVLQETNYRPNVLARELQQKKTNTIGVLMAAGDLNLISISETLNTVTDVLRDNGYNMMLANSRFSMEEEIDIFRIFQEKRVDGVLFLAHEFKEEHYNILKNYPAPIVLIGQEYKRLDIPAAIHDDFHAARDATVYLIEHGHERIGYIGCPSHDEATGVKRKRGFEFALESYNLLPDPSLMTVGDFSIQSGYDAIIEMEDSPGGMPTAVFATTDYMAIGAIKALKDKGYKVPEEVSIIGFDDVNVAGFTDPPLTTIRTDKVAVGKNAAHHLLDCIQSGRHDKVIYTSSYALVERESVANKKA